MSWFSRKWNTEALTKSKVDWEKVNKGDRTSLLLPTKQDAVITEKKSMDDLIKEIHETFYTEVDRLLEYANIQKTVNKTSDEISLVEKSDRLKKLGFNQTKEVVNSKEIIKREAEIELENEEKQKLIETINYFSIKYPQYKFITEESVNKICQKYGLIYGTVDKYKGTVPDKNLADIESFKINENDACYQESYFYANFSGYRDERLTFFDKKHFDVVSSIKKKEEHDDLDDFYRFRMMGESRAIYSKSPFEIAAPIDDFDTEGMEVKNNKLQFKKVKIPDPVVLQPVFHNGQKHYLIVTAWGLEASDELVVNQNMN